jgi:hypothetical protein
MEVVIPTVGKVIDGATEINKTRDYVAQRTATVTPVSKGGTGATAAAAARTNLGAAAAAHTHSTADLTSGVLASARVPNLDAAKITAGTLTRPVSASGDVYASGNLRTPNRVLAPGVRAVTVTQDYASVYVDVNGWFGISPSAARFKQDIKPLAFGLEDALAVQVVSYRLRDRVAHDPDASAEWGVIAEQLMEVGLGGFVVRDADGQPVSVAYDRMVILALGALQDAASLLDTITARLAALEAAVGITTEGQSE